MPRAVDQSERSVVATDESDILGNRHAIDESMVLVNERKLIIPTVINRLAMKKY